MRDTNRFASRKDVSIIKMINDKKIKRHNVGQITTWRTNVQLCRCSSRFPNNKLILHQIYRKTWFAIQNNVLIVENETAFVNVSFICKLVHQLISWPIHKNYLQLTHLRGEDVQNKFHIAATPRRTRVAINQRHPWNDDGDLFYYSEGSNRQSWLGTI